MDDPNLDGYNVPTRVAQFEQAMNVQKNQFPTNNLIVTMGMDFNYVNSIPWFLNMDALIRGINNKSTTYHAVYSTPSCYTKAVYNAVKSLTNKTDDFFPYADKPQAYWTGYFTSRPALKRLVRDLVNWFGTARQLLALSQSKIDQQTKDRLFNMQDAQGIMQHHDAVTGTAKQAVTDDYRKRTSIALDHGKKISTRVLRELHCGGKLGDDCKLKDEDSLVWCNLYNETFCTFTEQKRSFSIVVYNPMAEATTHWLRIPVTKSANYFVVGPNGDAVTSDLVPILDDIKSIPTRKLSVATHELVFRVSLPPMGSSVYFVENEGQVEAQEAQVDEVRNLAQKSEGEITWDGKTAANSRLRLSLDPRGRLNSLERDGVKMELTHFLAFYSARGMPSPPSGAYLFNPDSTEPRLFTEEPATKLVLGSNVFEIHQQYATWAKAIIRFYSDSDELELQWIAGPIPTETGTVEQLNRAAANQQVQQPQWGWGGGGGVGREIVSVFESSIDSQKRFYTDTNGREMLERKKDFRPTWSLQTTEPVSQNYYPLNARISINDTQNAMTVVVDRACGGTGFRDGQLEVMLHRRLVQDDQLGVGEALHEIENGKSLVVTGRHWLLADPNNKMAKHSRKFGQKVMFPPVVAFSHIASRAKWNEAKLKVMTSVGSSAAAGSDALSAKALLPPNVNLLTLEREFNDCWLMLRLEHLFEGGEDSQMSKPATVELMAFVKKLLGSGNLDLDIEEMALGGNMPLKDLVKLKWETSKTQAVCFLSFILLFPCFFSFGHLSLFLIRSVG